MRTMKVTDWIHAIAGLFILGSLVPGHWASPWSYWLAAFVGLNNALMPALFLCELQSVASVR